MAGSAERYCEGFPLGEIGRRLKYTDEEQSIIKLLDDKMAIPPTRVGTDVLRGLKRKCSLCHIIWATSPFRT